MYKLYLKKNITSKELIELMKNDYSIEDKVVYNNDGKPYFENNKLYFNISKANAYIVGVISDKEIGIDIEEIAYKKRVLKRFTAEEQLRVKTPDDFTITWVKKESYLKYLGKGISYGLKNIDTTELNNFKIIKYSNYYIAICFGE